MVNVNWETTTLGKVATLQRGYDLPHRLRKPGKIPIITSSGIGDTHSTAMIAGPGVVTGRYGTIGKVFYIDRDFWPLNTTLYVKDFHGNNPLFVSYLLRTIDFHSHSGKSGVPGVNRNDLHQLTVGVPPTKTEQVAIAEVLSDLDSLIGALDKLIAKKRNLKQAVMQQLLTGKRRLPGFSWNWEV
jgi:type I restriction enzyme S subunit